jgi:predicted Zn-dependent peptidase
MTIDMMDEGSLGRSAIEMHEALARLGAQLDADIGPDAAVLTVTVLSRFADEALRLLADMVVRPSLAESDFSRVRDLRLHRLAQLRDMPGAVADRAFVKLLYGAHPYGHTPLGTEQALAAMTVDEVRSFHAAAITPSASTLIVVGDCTHEDIRRTAVEALGGWTEGPPADSRPATLPASPPRLNVIARPGAPQSELRLGHVAVARSTPDYHALVAANTVLGGQFVSRINLNLREDKGLTYGARTSFDFRRLPGPFVLQASVATQGTGRAVEESIAEVRAIRGPRPVTMDELTLGVAALTRGYARNFETAEQVARAVSQIALYDLADSYFEEFVPTLERITPEDVTRVAARHLDPDRLMTLIVGDVDAIGADLARLNLSEPAICSAETF